MAAALSPEQQRVLSRILSIGRRVGATPKEIKAAVETGLVESNLRNLSGGDADSAGWRQERASLYKDPTNLDASIRRFFEETAAVRGQYGSSGALAAAVQRPAAQYRGRYAQRAGEAAALMGGTSGGTDSGSQSDGGSTSTTTTTPGVDNSQARAQLVLSFLQGNRSDPVGFASQYKQLADVPGTSTTTRTRSASAHQSASSYAANGAPSHGSKVLELIFNDGAKGYGIKDGAAVDGRSVFSAVWDGHADHVHVAAGPKTVVALGRLAQQMGLHVGENPHFGGVDPVHVPGSYHYKGEAIDVSGTKQAMARYARAVERYNQRTG